MPKRQCTATNEDGTACQATVAIKDGLCPIHARYERGLTEMQELFVHEYMVDCNATQAAIRAGYSARTAKVMGTKLRHSPRIKQRINELLEERQVGALELVEMLRQHAHASARPFLRLVENEETEETEVVVDLTTEQAQDAMHLIKEIKHDSAGRLQLKFVDSQAAIVHLCKIAGLFIDRVEVGHVDRRELKKRLDELDELSAEDLLKRYRESLH